MGEEHERRFRAGAFALGPYAGLRQGPNAELNVFGAGPGVDIRYSIRLDASAFRAGGSLAQEDRFWLGGHQFVIRDRLALDAKLGANAYAWVNLHLSPQLVLDRQAISAGIGGMAGGRIGLQRTIDVARVVNEYEESLASVSLGVGAEAGARASASGRLGGFHDTSNPFSWSFRQRLLGVGVFANEKINAENVKGAVGASLGAGVDVSGRISVNPLNIAKAADDLVGGALGVQESLRKLRQVKRTAADAASSGLRRAANVVREPHKMERRKDVLQFVSKMGLVSVDQLAQRFVVRPGEDVRAARPRTEAMVKELVASGYVRWRDVILDGKNVDASRVRGHRPANQIHERVLWVTPKAAKEHPEWRLPKPPTIREAFIPHHLKTLDALLRAEAQLKADGHRVLELKTEDHLVREWFQGKKFDATLRDREQGIPKFPDGALIVANAAGEPEQVNLEYATTKYSDEMIKDKVAAFRGRTIWAVDRASTASRVESITGSKPLLV